MTVIEGEGITNYHLLQCYYALQIEVNTGMRHSRGSVLKLVQRTYGVKSRTKKGAMAEIEQIMRDRGVPINEKED